MVRSPHATSAGNKAYRRKTLQPTRWGDASLDLGNFSDDLELSGDHTGRARISSPVESRLLSAHFDPELTRFDDAPAVSVDERHLSRREREFDLCFFTRVEVNPAERRQ